MSEMAFHDNNNLYFIYFLIMFLLHEHMLNLAIMTQAIPFASVNSTFQITWQILSMKLASTWLRYTYFPAMD